MEGEEYLLYSGNTLFKCVNSIFKRELELYLPKNPRSDAGKELKEIRLRLRNIIREALPSSLKAKNNTKLKSC